MVRKVADRFQLASLLRDTFGYGLVSAEGMRTASFAESANDRYVRRFHKQELCMQLLLELAIDVREGSQCIAFAHVYDQRGAGDGPALLCQLSKLRNELNWQIIDCEESEILERFQDCTLPRAAKPGDDHQLRPG